MKANCFWHTGRGGEKGSWLCGGGVAWPVRSWDGSVWQGFGGFGRV